MSDEELLDSRKLRAAFFASADPESTKKTGNLTVFLRFWDLGV